MGGTCNMHRVNKIPIQNSNREVQKEELPRGRLILKLVFKTDSRDLNWTTGSGSRQGPVENCCRNSKDVRYR